MSAPTLSEMSAANIRRRTNDVYIICHRDPCLSGSWPSPVSASAMLSVFGCVSCDDTSFIVVWKLNDEGISESMLSHPVLIMFVRARLV